MIVAWPKCAPKIIQPKKRKNNNDMQKAEEEAEEINKKLTID